ncbi:MAG: pyridoxal 5'-phosphate synthase glutaminase subunit PdxT [Propionibacteriaceae bacterium]
MTRPLVGVLALQGDVVDHCRALTACGADVRLVRRPAELTGLAGLVLPGGESTTIDRLARLFGLRDPLRAALADGLPAFGSCAGMIMLANEVVDGTSDQQTFGGLDITVRRNAFGRQVDSFETDLHLTGVPGGPMHAVFIRAPWVERAGPDVEILATAADHPVAVRQGALLATSFHPEATTDVRVHQLFVDRL